MRSGESIRNTKRNKAEDSDGIFVCERLSNSAIRCEGKENSAA
jgi:hypothetical protein